MKIPELCLGNLLTTLGWISNDQLEEALAIASETAEPIGRVLVSRGDLSQAEINSVVTAQSLVRDGYITDSEARRALSITSWCGMSFDGALLFFMGKEIECFAPYQNRIGQLLFMSGCITKPELESALIVSRNAGMQLGRLLVLRKKVTESFLSAALEAQALIRSGSISLRHAILGLLVIRAAAEDTSAAKDENLPLGALFARAGVLTERSIEDALEVSRTNARPLGQVLLIFALITNGQLQAALQLQTLLKAGRIRAQVAVNALQLVATQNLPLEQALAQQHMPTNDGNDISLALFLKRTGWLQEKTTELERALHMGAQNRDQMQFLRSFINANQLRMGIRCTFLVRHSILSFEQALLAFHCSLMNGMDIDVFLSSVDWVAPETLDTLAFANASQSQRRLTVVHSAA